MSEINQGFFDRAAGGFTAAAIAFLPGFFVLCGNTGYPDLFTWFDNQAAAISYLLSIILAAIFVIAYPVERWFVKPGHSIYRICSTYFIFITLLGLALFLATSIFRLGLYSMVFLWLTPIATVTAIAGRVIYVYSGKLRVTNRVIALVLVALIALPYALGK